MQISQGYIIRILQHFATKLWNITNFVMLFHAMMEFCLDLLQSKFWLIGEWSIKTKDNFLSGTCTVHCLQTIHVYNKKIIIQYPRFIQNDTHKLVFTGLGASESLWTTVKGYWQLISNLLINLL